jgi:peptide/nickel transport system permease protein
MGIFLQYTFAIQHEIFPTIGIKTPGFEDPLTITGFRLFDSLITGRFELFKDTLLHLILPLFTLTSYGIAMLYKRVRRRFLHVLNQEYTKTALMKGSKINLKSHFARSMRFRMILSDLRIILPSFLSMVMIVEFVFNLKGLGMLFVDSVFFRDVGVTVGVIWYLTVWILFLNTDIALLEYLLDPRYNPRQNYDISNISRVS